jgi:serine/threonine-protein kinase
MKSYQAFPKSMSPADEPTTDYPVRLSSRRPRCKMARAGESGPHLTGEITCLLRSRMLIAAGLSLAVFVIYLAISLLDPVTWADVPVFQRVFHFALIGELAAAVVILLRPRPLSVTWLRAMELTLFGSIALFFAWVQLTFFHDGKVLESAAKDHEHTVQRLATLAYSCRWFVLIVIYGTFIPNTWRRSAVVVGVLTATPILLGCGLYLSCPLLQPHLGDELLVMVPFLGTGAAIAIFGSYKISVLHKEAFEARQLGQYQLKRRLGAGGMGEVYLAEHMMLRRPCAIKLIHTEQAGDPRNLARFEREVQTTATLTHWNTVEIFDYGHTDDGTFYYVMEYLPGLSLQDLVEKAGPLPPERVIHLVRQVCYALREAHGIGLIHRDIKPSNILACTRGGVDDVAKLLDFGIVQSLALSKDAVKLTVDGAIAGSPPFMSPEQASGKSTLDARSDIYSLGAVTYFLLAGQPPFPRETAMEMLMSHVYEPVVPLTDLRPDLPADLQEVVLRCLQKDPGRRFPDADSLNRALADCAAAGLWTEDLARQWWRDHGGQEGAAADLAAVS